MGVHSAAASNPDHTAAAVKARQQENRRADANQSTRPGERTLAEIQKEYKR